MLKTLCHEASWFLVILPQQSEKTWSTRMRTNQNSGWCMKYQVLKWSVNKNLKKTQMWKEGWKLTAVITEKTSKLITLNRLCIRLPDDFYQCFPVTYQWAEADTFECLCFHMFHDRSEGIVPHPHYIKLPDGFRGNLTGRSLRSTGDLCWKWPGR